MVSIKQLIDMEKKEMTKQEYKQLIQMCKKDSSYKWCLTTPIK